MIVTVSCRCRTMHRIRVKDSDDVAPQLNREPRRPEASSTKHAPAIMGAWRFSSVLQSRSGC
jgi:hypothetical protein